MKLFYAPGVCSMGIHAILQEIGAPFEAVKISLRDGPEARAALDAVNPKGKVPTIQCDDGSVITEYPAIAAWLAETNPGANLLPTDPAARARAMEAIDFCVATIHMQGFSRWVRPANFAPSEADHAAVKARGQEIMEKGFTVMAATLGDSDWVAGPYSIADSALFYVEYWAVNRMGLTLAPPVAAHFARMLARPAVQRMLAAEGLPA